MTGNCKIWIVGLLTTLTVAILGINVYPKVAIDNVVEIGSLYSTPPEPEIQEMGEIYSESVCLEGEWWRTTNFSRDNAYSIDDPYWNWQAWTPADWGWNDSTPCSQAKDYRWIKGKVCIPDGSTSIMIYGKYKGGVIPINDGIRVYVNGDFFGSCGIPGGVPSWWGGGRAWEDPESYPVSAGWFTQPWDITGAVNAEVNTIALFLVEGCNWGGIGGFEIRAIVPKIDYIKVFPDPACVLPEKELQFVVKGYIIVGEKDEAWDPVSYEALGEGEGGADKDIGPIDIVARWSLETTEVDPEAPAGTEIGALSGATLEDGTITGESVKFTAGQYTGKGKVKVTRCGKLTDEVDVAVYQLGIEEIWSDQYSGVKANYLPGGSGSKGYEYILMGARADGKAYAKAKIKIEPDVDFVRDRVIARLARNTTPEGDGTIETTTEGNIASIWIDDIYQDDYTVVAGLDLNYNQQLDGDEISASTHYKLKIISKVTYNGAFNYLDFLLVRWAGWGALTAKAFLDCFLHDCEKIGRLAPRDINISINEPYHNVGVVFTDDGSGTAKEYLFPPGDYLSRKIMNSDDFALYVKYWLGYKKREVQKYFNDNPKEQTHTFPWEFSNGTRFSDRDLGNAFGWADFDLKVEAKVKRKDLELIRLEVSGKVTDFYQWDYGEAYVDSLAASVQACYNTLAYIDGSKGGHIFKVSVYLSGVVPNLHYSFE